MFEIKGHGFIHFDCFLFYAVSSLTDATIDPAEYTLRRPLSDRLTLYARIVGVML